MDPGFRYNLYYTQDASEVCFPDSSLEMDVFPGVTQDASLLYFHHAFSSRPVNPGEFGEADEDLGEVRYHPGYLRFYPTYAVCAPARRVVGTGVFHPLIPFADGHGTLFWLPTEAVHLESWENSRRMYLTDEFIYTVETYASSCATQFGEVLALEAIHAPVGGEYAGRRRASSEAVRDKSSFTPTQQSRSTAESIERLMGVTSAPSLSIGEGGSNWRDSDGPDEVPRSNTTSNSKGKQQAQEDEASRCIPARRGDQPGQALAINLPDIVGEKLVEFGAKDETVESFGGASARTRASAEGKNFQTFASVVGSSRNLTARQSSETTAEQVMLEQVVDLTIGSVQEDLPTSPPLTGTEGSISDILPELAHSLPGEEPEGYNGNVGQNLRKEESEATDRPKINVQEDQAQVENFHRIVPHRSKELSIAYTDPYWIHQPEEEKVEITPNQFRGDFLNEEMWPPLPITQDLGPRTTVLSNRGERNQEGPGSLHTNSDGAPHQALGASLPTNCDETGQGSESNLSGNRDPAQNQAVLDTLTIILEKRSEIGCGADTVESIVDVSTITPLPHSRISEGKLVEKIGAQTDEDHSIDYAAPSRIQQPGEDKVALAQVKGDFVDEELLPALPITHNEGPKATLLRKSAGQGQTGSPEDQAVGINLPNNSDGKGQASRSILTRKSDQLEQAMLSNSPDQIGDKGRETEGHIDPAPLIVGASASTYHSHSRSFEENLAQTTEVQRGTKYSIACTDPYGSRRPKEENVAMTPAEFKGDFGNEELWPTLPIARDEGFGITPPGKKEVKKSGRGFGATVHKCVEDLEPGTLLSTDSAWQDKALATILRNSGKEYQALGTAGLPSISDRIDEASKNLLTEHDQLLVQASLSGIPHTVGDKGKEFEDEADTLQSTIGTPGRTHLLHSRTHEGKLDQRIGSQRRVDDVIAYTDNDILQTEEKNVANTPEEFEGDFIHEELWPAPAIIQDQGAKTALPRSSSEIPLWEINLSSDNPVQSILPTTTPTIISGGDDQGPGTPVLTDNEEQHQVLGTSLPSHSYGQPRASGSNLPRKTDQLEQAGLTGTPNICGEKGKELEDKVALVQSVVGDAIVGATIHLVQSRISEGMVLEKTESQRRIEQSIASTNPYKIQLGEENVANTPKEFEGHFLDEEMWPALPTYCLR